MSLINFLHRSLWLILFFSQAASALDPNSQLPIQIESDQASLSDETGIAVYTGNVIISQGLSRLEADTISVNAIDHRLVSIKATGKPAHFTQQDNANEPITHGYGNNIVYVAKENLLKFLGQARLVQDENSFSGEEIEYDIVKRAIKAKGDESIGSRVKIRYTPNNYNNTADSTSNATNQPNTDLNKE